MIPFLALGSLYPAIRVKYCVEVAIETDLSSDDTVGPFCALFRPLLQVVEEVHTDPANCQLDTCNIDGDVVPHTQIHRCIDA